jgi:hypothetical protein
MAFPSVRAQDLFSIRGKAGEETETMQARSRHATNKYMSLIGTLLKCQDGPQVRRTVDAVCIEDLDQLRMMSEYQLGLLRRGLQALMFAKGIAA